MSGDMSSCGFTELQPVLQQVVLATLREARAKVEREGFESVWSANVAAAAMARTNAPPGAHGLVDGIAAAALVGKRLVTEKLQAARAVMDAYDVAIQELEAPMESRGTSTADFRRWRREVDSDEQLDTFDLALGWFSGRGVPHDEALRLAEALAVSRQAVTSE